MIDLNSIIQSAQGGQAIDNLSARFGLTPVQTQSAIDAMLPALTMGLQNAMQGGGFGSVLSHLANPVHQQAYADHAAVPDAEVHGGAVLGDLFGSHQTATQVTQQAATVSGIPASIIQAMLPVVISMVMGGLMHGAQNGAFGGILSSVLGSVLGGQGGQTGGLLGGVLGGLFGGSADAGAAGSAAPPTNPAVPATPAAPASTQATLDEISGMFTSGTPASPEHEAALATILGR